MRVQMVDPSAFTPPYDHALCAALARAGAQVELITSRFAYGDVPAPAGYERRELFYRWARGAPGSRVRQASKLAEHVPDMLALRRRARRADIVHFQWLDVQWLDDRLLPPGPVVLTAHDLLPREPRRGQAEAQRRVYDRVDAIIVHSDYGRDQLVTRLGVPERKVHVVHHGAFDHLAALTPAAALTLPADLAGVSAPVVLFFGLLRPYKGLEPLLAAWDGVSGAELWIVGRPRMDIAALRAAAPASVRWMSRFVSDEEIPALMRRADLVVLPYSRTERLDFSGVLATALAFGKPIIVSDVGGFAEVAASGAARLVAPDDSASLRGAIIELLSDPAARTRLGAGALAAARGPYSWHAAAQATLEVYRSL